MRILLLFTTSILAFAAGQFHHHQIEDKVNQIFRIVDENHDGTLSLAQLHNAFLRKDANHDNKVTLQEFEAGHTPEDMAVVSDVFRILDNDNDGVLEGGEGVVALHRHVDDNNDGKISVGEFKDFYTNVVQNAVNEEHSHGHGHGHHHHG